ncbi:MAG: hypothetical protein AAGC55_25240, partial [Myxococcota bacterium]
VGRFVLARAEEAPLVVVCDDGHRAGAALLGVLEYVTRADVAGALWVCVLARPQLRDARPQWAGRAAEPLTVELGALDRAAVAELAGRLLHPADTIPGHAVDLLVDRSRGVPLHLVELIRLVRRQGAVRRRARSASWYLAVEVLDRVVPAPSARWLAERELAGMTGDLAGHAHLCAVLGDPLDPGDVDGVIAQLERAGGADAVPLDGRAGMAALVALGVLVAEPDGRARFRHAAIRDAMAELTPVALRRAVHRAAAAHYRAMARVGDRRLAQHAAAAGDEDAGTLHLALAEGARDRHDYAAAESDYSRALDLLGADHRAPRMAALRGRGQIRYRHARHGDALADFRAARSLARDLGDGPAELAIVLDASTALDWGREFAQSRQWVREAEELARPLEPLGAELTVHLELARARALWRDPARCHEAPPVLARVVERAQAVGDAAYEPRIIALLMTIDIQSSQGAVTDAERAADSALRLARAHGDMGHVGAVMINRRLVWFARDQPERVLADADHYRALGRELGIVGWL